MVYSPDKTWEEWSRNIGTAGNRMIVSLNEAIEAWRDFDSFLGTTTASDLADSFSPVRTATEAQEMIDAFNALESLDKWARGVSTVTTSSTTNYKKILRKF